MPIIALCLYSALALLLTLGQIAIAQKSTVWSEPGQVHFESLTLADGLYDSTVFSITQDASGQIWFGTAAGGANRFDGYRITAYLHEPVNEQSLSHSAAGEVLAASDGTILIGTWGGGMNRYSGLGDRFEHLNPGRAPRQIQIMFEDSRQRIWVGSADSGLYQLDHPQGLLRPVLRSDGQPFSRVWAVAEDGMGVIWVATDNGLFDLSGREIKPPTGWHGHPRALLFDNSTLWIGDTQTVYRVLDGTPQPVLENSELVNTLALSPGGQILVGTLAGILALDSTGRQVAPFGRSEQVLFPNRNIRRFYFDSSGVGWIATREAGLLRALPAASGFDGFRLESSLDTVDTLHELSENDLLIGSRRGLWRLQHDQGVSRFHQIPGTESESINRFTHHGDAVLIGTNEGVLTFDPVSGSLEADPLYNSLSNLGVTSLHSWSDGRMDIGTWINGLHRFDADGNSVHYIKGGENHIAGVSISDLEPDPAGGIWVGMWNDGVAHIDSDGTVTNVSSSELGIEGQVHDLLLDNGMLWVATSFGLACFDPQRRTNMRVILIPEYPNTSVQRLAAGNDRLWAATTRGVIAIDRDDMSISRFGIADGLVVQEFFARSGHVGSGDRLYFGGLGGLVSFLPDDVALDVSPPSAAIVGAWVDDEAVTVNEPIIMQPGAGTLRFRHVVADYRSPQANRFRSRLIGRDDSWSEANADPETLLTGLDPGEYRFELQAANANGLWNESAASLSIRVLPAWWQTPLGQLSVILGLSLLAYLWNYGNTRRIRARNRELTQEVDRQTRALREANRSLAQAASTDHLTGLLNRRGFLAQVETVDQSDIRWFALLDVDNFKQFNDQYGHDVGDQVLSHVAEILRESSPPGAHVARWGGEEFIIHFQLPDSSLAINAVERVREAVQDQQLDMAIPAVSVTGGLARMQLDETCMSAINRADARLLRGKADGKNRLIADGDGMRNRRG